MKYDFVIFKSKIMVEKSTMSQEPEKQISKNNCFLNKARSVKRIWLATGFLNFLFIRYEKFLRNVNKEKKLW